MDDKVLLAMALEARKFCHVPYSHFRVGAALLCKDGRVFTGCNIENSAYPDTICAERTAFFKAVSEGAREFAAIAVVGGYEAEAPLASFAYPCGSCRQVMREFCNPEEFRILVGRSSEDYHSYLLQELLPFGFGPEDLNGGSLQ